MTSIIASSFRPPLPCPPHKSTAGTRHSCRHPRFWQFPTSLARAASPSPRPSDRHPSHPAQPATRHHRRTHYIPVPRRSAAGARHLWCHPRLWQQPRVQPSSPICPALTLSPIDLAALHLTSSQPCASHPSSHPAPSTPPPPPHSRLDNITRSPSPHPHPLSPSLASSLAGPRTHPHRHPLLPAACIVCAHVACVRVLPRARHRSSHPRTHDIASQLITSQLIT